MTLKHSFCIFLCFSTPAFAAESDDLFSMSFEDLLEVQIDIASKTSETIATAPSTITVFNRKTINLLGVDSAYELMNFVPGMQSTRGDWVGAVPKDHARGVYLDSGNILVMINGERVNESSFGKASVYMPFIPVEVIDKVEFIRGPGSALYGSNAFIGVMNIVTKQTDNEVSATVASNDKYAASFNGQHQFNELISGYTAFSFTQKEGESYPQGVNDPLQSTYVELGLDVAKAKIRARYNKVELDEFLNLAGYSKQNQHTSENTFVSLAYQWLESDETNLVTKVAYADHKISSAGMVLSGLENPAAVNDFFIGPDWHTTNLNFNIDYSHQFENDWVINAGYEYLRAKQIGADVRTNYYDPDTAEIVVEDAFYLGEITTIKNYTPFLNLKTRFETQSGYTQVKIPFSSEFTLFLGGRYDDVKNIDSKLSPRIAAIYQPSAASTLKLQYGESFRTPVTNELYSDDDVTVGNPELNSEYVKTTELIWRYQAADWHFNTVFFFNQLHDFITTVPQESNTNMFTFANQLDDSNRGIEFDSSWQISSDFNVTMTYTQYFDEPIKPTFKRFASLLASYEFDAWLLSLNGIWRDEINATNVNFTQFTQPSYTILGTTARFSLDQQNSVTLKINNILDKHYSSFDPRVADGAVAGVSREVSLQYLLKF